MMRSGFLRRSANFSSTFVASFMIQYDVIYVEEKRMCCSGYVLALASFPTQWAPVDIIPSIAMERSLYPMALGTGRPRRRRAKA